MFVRTTSTESNKSEMRLIRSNKKNARKLSNAKTRIENQKQNKTKSEKIVETTEKNSFDQKTNKRIYL